MTFAHLHGPGPRQSPRGFTLIEMLVTLAIATVLAVFAAGFMRDIIIFDSELRGILMAQDDARRTFKLMVKEIRLINFADNGAYPITQAETTSFIFYSDVNGDGRAERLRYFLSGTTLYRGYIAPVGTPPVYSTGGEVVTSIATNLDNGATPIFTYYDSSYDGTSAPLATPVTIFSIRLVKLTIIVNKNAIRAPSNQTYSTQVSLRNLKDNL
jgi:prepilin-type N-terminal cleavage/methylation domain-containing protein